MISSESPNKYNENQRILDIIDKEDSQELICNKNIIFKTYFLIIFFLILVVSDYLYLLIQ